MVSSYMRSKATSDQLLVLGLGAAGALAAVALSAVMYTAASKRRRQAHSCSSYLTRLYLLLSQPVGYRG